MDDWVWDSVDLGEGVSGPKAKKSPKSLEKGKSPKKVSKKVRKVSKNPFSDFSETFRTFFETFFRTFGTTGPGGTFSRLFGDFLAFGPETPSPRCTEFRWTTGLVRNSCFWGALTLLSLQQKSQARKSLIDKSNMSGVGFSYDLSPRMPGGKFRSRPGKPNQTKGQNEKFMKFRPFL